MGYLEVLRWCKANGCRLGDTVVRAAARSERLEIPKWYQAAIRRSRGTESHQRSPSCTFAGVCSEAVVEGHLDIVEWCWRKHLSRSADTCGNAARGGHFEVLKWCRANGCPWDETTCAGAVEAGDLEMLQWCRDTGFP